MLQSFGSLFFKALLLWTLCWLFPGSLDDAVCHTRSCPRQSQGSIPKNVCISNWQALIFVGITSLLKDSFFKASLLGKEASRC